MSAPVLTPGDRQSAVWQKLEKYLNAQLDVLRRKNDADLSDAKTQRLRGRIAAVRDLLSLGTDTPIHQSDDAIFKD